MATVAPPVHTHFRLCNHSIMGSNVFDISRFDIFKEAELGVGPRTGRGRGNTGVVGWLGAGWSRPCEGVKWGESLASPTGPAPPCRAGATD